MFKEQNQLLSLLLSPQKTFAESVSLSEDKFHTVSNRLREEVPSGSSQFVLSGKIHLINNHVLPFPIQRPLLLDWVTSELLR